jgi:hypothetical protein
MAMEQTAETWIRIDLRCDGLGDDGTCVLAASDGLGAISDVAPTAEGAQKAIINRAMRSGWAIDVKRRWLCSECRAARDASKDMNSTSGYVPEAGSIVPHDEPSNPLIPSLADCAN